ncbi:hypothetical protein V1264_016605 [Littorina saxatilis]|uniref:AIG1-type G domain-containing protein n=1 Tax=Littorina saxatilis TaxID=31220 RepID=A0AAN9BGT5_9CAEN
MPEDRRREVAKWVELTGSKPDAVILTIRSDDKYTPEKKSIYTKTKSLMGGDLSQVLVLAFTFGDQQERNFERDLKRAGKHLHDVMTEAKGRYVIFNAKAVASAKDAKVSELIRIVRALDTPPEDDSRFQHREAAYSEAGATSRQRIAAYGAPLQSKLLRLLIVGEMGSGKSTLANMILHRNAFTTGSGMSEMTQTAQKERAFLDNVEVEVVDTPDIVNAKMPEDRRREVAKWVELTGSKPDAVILTIRSDDKYTPEKKSIYTKTKSLMGGDLSQVLVLAFTFGDQQERNFERDLKRAGKHLHDVMTEAKGRYVIFNAKAVASAKDAKVSELIRIVRALDTPPEDDSRFQHREAAYSEAGATSRQQIAAYGAPLQSKLLRLLIVGEMGSGKSTLANMILHRNAFTTGSGMSEMTQTAQKERAFLDNVEVEVVDTPDIVNAKMPEDRRREVAKWVELTGSKPDAVILTIRSDDKYTPEKKSIYTKTKSLMGGDLSQVLVLAFTFGDQQERNFERDLQRAGKHLHDVMTEAKGRYVIFNAKAVASAKDAKVSELIRIVRALGK